jgi:flagellar secretion chaperone FliS
MTVMNAIVAINAYKKIGVESKVTGADPHQLISLLYHGALAAIANAKDGLEHKDIEAKGKSISKAIAIIGEGLHASLDKKVGGEMAQQMSALYDYMVRRLFDANLHNDAAALDEVTRLLAELTEAWDSIRPTSAPSVPPNASINAHLAYARV